MRHEFALFADGLSAACLRKKSGDFFLIVDQQLWHRLKHVLRAQPGTLVALFDHTLALEAKLHAFEKKEQLQFTLVKPLEKPLLKPIIIVMLPLLKREALTDALYSCVELGANQVQLVTTEHSQHAWSSDRDNARCQKIMVAAAEQSKQFTVPTMSDPIPLADAIVQLPVPTASTPTFRIHCDPQGTPLWRVIDQLEKQKPATIVLSFGPEADLTDAERALLYQNQFVACALTPTVLRATQALVVALGALRSSGTLLT